MTDEDEEGVQLHDVQMASLEEAGAAIIGPLVVNLSAEDRDDAVPMMNELLEHWKGRANRAKQEWYSALSFNILVIAFMCFGTWLTYDSYIQPVLDLHTWSQVQDCRIETAKLDFLTGIRGLYSIPVLEVSYPQKGSLQRITGFATPSVTGVGADTAVDNAHSSLACWVDPSNPYRVALSIEESVALQTYLMIVVLVILILLQVINLVQAARTGQVKFCICSKNNKRYQGYTGVNE